MVKNDAKVGSQVIDFIINEIIYIIINKQFISFYAYNMQPDRHLDLTFCEQQS